MGENPGGLGTRQGKVPGTSALGGDPARRRDPGLRGQWDQARVPGVDPERTEALLGPFPGQSGQRPWGGRLGSRENLWRGSFFRGVPKLESGHCGEKTW